jgi:hypothetical protein
MIIDAVSAFSLVGIASMEFGEPVSNRLPDPPAPLN